MQRSDLSLSVNLNLKGSHLITVDQKRFGPTCGLMPFASQVQGGSDSGPRIWTEGLKWNLGMFLLLCKNKKKRYNN